MWKGNGASKTVKKGKKNTSPRQMHVVKKHAQKKEENPCKLKMNVCVVAGMFYNLQMHNTHKNQT